MSSSSCFTVLRDAAGATGAAQGLPIAERIEPASRPWFDLKHAAHRQLPQHCVQGTPIDLLPRVLPKQQLKLACRSTIDSFIGTNRSQQYQ